MISIGLSKKGHNVFPEEWIDRSFESALQIHREMDSLDWRLGKPPVVYCLTYGLSIKKESQWLSYTPLYREALKTGLYVRITLANNEIITEIEKFTSEGEINQWISSLKNNQQLLLDRNVVLALETSQFFYTKEKTSFIKTDQCGVLSSRLQKCIRRGNSTGPILEETIKKMWKNPGYNLPELQFLRVNSNRQIFWRLFISCIEDMSPYVKGGDYLGLDDLIVFSVITSIDSELQMNDFLIEKVVKTARLIQGHDKKEDLFDWRKGSENIDQKTLKIEKDNGDYYKKLKNGLILALETQNMMSGDRKMIIKTFNLLTPFTKIPILSTNPLSSIINPVIIHETLLATYDMHCIPNIILLLQGSLNFLPTEPFYTTQGISSLIWELSSSYNIRRVIKEKSIKDMEILRILQEIQGYYLEKEQEQKKGFMGLSEEGIDEDYKGFLKGEIRMEFIEGEELSENEKRIGFLNLFGKKIRFLSKSNKSLEGIFCGDKEHLTKIKTINSNKMVYLTLKDRFQGEIDFINELSIKNKHFIDNPKAPLGFQWIWGSKKVEISAFIVKSDPETLINEVKTFVNGKEIALFDASSVLKPIKRVKPLLEIPFPLQTLIESTLYIIKDPLKALKGFKLNLLLRGLASIRLKSHDFRVYDVYPLFISSKTPCKLWKHVLIKLFTGNKDEILIGPVDRQGKKLQNSISYLYEGIIWRIYNLLYLLYPRVLIITSDLRYKLNRNSPEYLHLYNLLLDLSKNKLSSIKETPKIHLEIPNITTKLWEHQESTVKTIYNGFIKGIKGFGDASCVGSGKTLTALSIIQKLAISNKNSLYKGFLILLPSQNLFTTWIEEIQKHTIGFIPCIQGSNGDIGVKIERNTLILTTLGRFRDHPLYNVSWQLVIIDECLSVQNREALQTEEAWKQVILAEFGVIMMSATFFRSRFDKMFFMLKMLRSGLPEEKEYLDCILNESMVCYINEKTRKWVANINRFQLPEDLRKGYDEIRRRNLSFEKLYQLLESYIYENYSIIKELALLIRRLEISNEKALIFMKSKLEADEISFNIPNVTRFPDIRGPHIVVAYSEGTYGLNNLVNCSCIVTRPPEPDKLPQMKGRLDRPGQKKEVLRLEYFLIGDTVEEGLLIRLDIANKFMNDYIMPMARFYEIAVKGEIRD